MKRLIGNLYLCTALAGCLSFAMVSSMATVASVRAAEGEYLPLAIGMERIMDLQVTSSNGDITNGIMHQKIEEAVQHNGKSYFRSHTWLENGIPFPMDYTKLLRKDAAGFYSIDERDPKRTERQKGRLPLEVGKKWETKVESGVLQTTVLAKEDAKIGNKIYKNCFRIRTTSAGGEYMEEFLEAPGVGTLTDEIKRADGSKWVLTLREFKNSNEE